MAESGRDGWICNTQTGPGWATGHRREEAIQKLLNQYQCAGCVQNPLIGSSMPFKAEVILSIPTLSRTEGAAAAGLPKARALSKVKLFHLFPAKRGRAGECPEFQILVAASPTGQRIVHINSMSNPAVMRAYDSREQKLGLSLVRAIYCSSSYR